MQEDVKEITIQEEDVAKLLRGERPEGMKYEEFKLKRKILTNWLRKYKKGRLINADRSK